MQKVAVTFCKRLEENPTEGFQWFKQRIESNIDDVSLAEASVFFDWYIKNEATLSDDFYYLQQPWLVVHELVDTKLTYLERMLNVLSSDEILGWLNHNQSLIQLGDFSAQAQRIRKTVFSQNIENPTAGLPWFKQRIDRNIDKVNLDEVNMFFDWYNESGKNIPEAVEVVQMGKQKMLDKVRQETMEYAGDLVRTYPWLEKLLPYGEKSLVGKGQSGIVVMGEAPNTAIKILDLLENIPPEKQSERLEIEVQIHNEFRQAIESGKLSTYDGNQPVPNWVHVPKIKKLINSTASKVCDRAYNMELVDGVTLKRWVYLNLDEYWSNLEPFTEQEIRVLSEIEFDKLVEKIKVNINVYQTFVDMDTGEILPEIFYKAFPKKTKGLQQALRYLKDEHQLVHPDLQWKNILIDEQGDIYLIDFAP